MTDKPTLYDAMAQAFRDHGFTVAITALTGGCIALAGTVARKAFPNEAMLVRLDREPVLERDRTDRQRGEDRRTDAKRLGRID